MITRSRHAATPAVGRPLSIAFVSTCPPRQCGIATFTSDLARAVKAADPTVRIAWVAINDTDSLHRYGPEVRWRIRQRDPASYREAAEQINVSTTDLVHLQHEFGLYGIWGESFDDHLVPFLETLRKPLVTTLHSILPAPSPTVRAAVRAIGRHSRRVIAMAEVARRLLVEVYGLEAAKVRVIPHGVPAIEPRGRSRIKRQLGLTNRTILSTFGLVDPRKGLEYMIQAMPGISERHPDAIYLIVGKTHPELARRAGEAYRNELSALVRSLGLSHHVAFVDEYLNQRQIIDYLLGSDVYVTPYLDPNQITSGTLAYALGAGKAIISTPYLHAAEALADDRGLVVDFRSASQLQAASLQILGNPALKRRLEQNAYASGREMTWPTVGEKTLALYRLLTAASESVPVPADLRVADAVPGRIPTEPLVLPVEPPATTGHTSLSEAP